MVHPLRERERVDAKVRIEDLRETAHESRESSVGLEDPTAFRPLLNGLQLCPDELFQTSHQKDGCELLEYFVLDEAMARLFIVVLRPTKAVVWAYP